MFASRIRTTVPNIELDLNEERLYRLPPMSEGPVIIHAYHAGVPLAGGGGILPIQDNDNDEPPLPTSDSGPARDLELELLHANHLSVRPDPNLTYPYIVLAQSLWYDDFWRLRIKRKQDPISPSSERRSYRIVATYPSQLPIIERRIPASFFQNGFERNYNDQQYIYITSGGSNVNVNFATEFRQLHDMDDLRIDMSPTEVHNITSTSVRFGTGYGPLRQHPPIIRVGSELVEAPSVGDYFFFSIRVDFAAGGRITAPGWSDADFPAFSFIVRLYLVASGDSLRYEPTIEADVFFKELDDINGASGNEEWEKLVTKLRQLQFSQPQGGESLFGKFLKPWLVGGNRELVSIAYAPGPGDTPDANGTIEPATGDLILRYVGPRRKPSTEPVLTDATTSTSSQPVNDNSIRLFDLPDEDPDPVPGAPTGGVGMDPRQPWGGIGALTKINHIVVLMQENRSFDQVLGYLSRDKINPEVEGLFPPDDPRSQQQFNRFNNRNFFPQKADKQDPQRTRATAWPSLLTPGPGHDYDDVATQMLDNMGGFVTNFSKRVGNEPSLLRLVMDYFGPDDLPVYASLTREFGICDHWYTAHAGPTWPNRFVLFTGDLSKDPDGTVEFDNPNVKTMLPLQQPTLFDYLNEASVSWRLFEHGYSFLRLFANFTYDITNIVPFDDPMRGFEAAAREGALPSVTFIEPDYIDLPPGNDDHPPADMAHGQVLVERIMKALIESPTWESTLFIITYDEHGGFYDHMNPPDDAPPLLGNLKKLGPRVPTFIISPLIARGAVFHSRFDHTSVGATILRRFVGGRFVAPPLVSPRMNNARDLREVLTLDTARPRSDFSKLFTPLPLHIAPRSAVQNRSARIGIPDSPKEDFHWLLSAMRLTTGQPPKPQTGVAQAPASPTPISEKDLVTKLEGLSKANPAKLNWKVSIVDLLKLLNLDSSYKARKKLAVKLGCPAELMKDSAKMNVWLHKVVLKEIAQIGGYIPYELLN